MRTAKDGKLNGARLHFELGLHREEGSASEFGMSEGTLVTSASGTDFTTGDAEGAGIGHTTLGLKPSRKSVVPVGLGDFCRTLSHR